MKVFLDTSAFAKRYVVEPGSDKVMALCRQADDLVVSVICLPELISTLSRLVRERKHAKADYRKLKGDAMADLADVHLSTHAGCSGLGRVAAGVASASGNGCSSRGMCACRRAR